MKHIEFKRLTEFELRVKLQKSLSDIALWIKDLSSYGYDVNVHIEAHQGIQPYIHHEAYAKKKTLDLIFDDLEEEKKSEKKKR